MFIWPTEEIQVPATTSPQNTGQWALTPVLTCMIVTMPNKDVNLHFTMGDNRYQKQYED